MPQALYEHPAETATCWKDGRQQQEEKASRLHKMLKMLLGAWHSIWKASDAQELPTDEDTFKSLRTILGTFT